MLQQRAAFEWFPPLQNGTNSQPEQLQNSIEMNESIPMESVSNSKIWRPWDENSTKDETKKICRSHPYKRCHMTMNQANPFHSYINTFKHPVKLYWTKAAYDYMYEAGERLLRNFPVQATIQVVEESDSDNSDDDDYDDDDDSTLEENSKQTQETSKELKKSTV